MEITYFMAKCHYCGEKIQVMDDEQKKGWIFCHNCGTLLLLKSDDVKTWLSDEEEPRD